MSEEKVVAIKIEKEIPFFGEGDTLEGRLRKVVLRGFPDIRIYERAKLEIVSLAPNQIQSTLYTPQPNVYANNLERVSELVRLFEEKGIDIMDLQKAYDFVARAESGQQTNWTIAPPIVERWRIPKSADGRLDYSGLIGERLADYLAGQGLGLNPELEKLPYPSETGVFDLVNDGIHRVHFGFLNKGIRILVVSDFVQGFPYYAAPQAYSSIKIVPFADDVSTAMKIHIVQSPGQKALYRNFPSGGILSGDVRPPTAGEVFT